MSTRDHGHDINEPGHHVPGTMDISEQTRTFGGFVKGTVYLCVGVAAILIFLALVNS